MKYAITSLSACLAFGLASPVLAADDLRGETFCFPAKDVPKLVDKLAEVKPKRRNVVDVRLMPRFVIKDGGVWPERFYLAQDGQTVTELAFSRETGAVPDFLAAARARPDTDICIDDPTRADRPAEDEGLYFEMGLSPLFKTTPGRHSLKELEEGTKDGKKFYKAMLPGPVALLMPDSDWLAIRMIDRMATPAAFAVTEAGEVPVTLEPFKDTFMVELDALEDLSATELIITGGAYDLQPIVSPKTLSRFGWGDATDEK